MKSNLESLLDDVHVLNKYPKSILNYEISALISLNEITMENEIWRNTTYPDIFISNMGRVFSLFNFQLITPLIDIINNQSRQLVPIHTDHEIRYIDVSVLVALAFIENFNPSDQTVIFFDNNPLNNKLENLRILNEKPSQINKQIHDLDLKHKNYSRFLKERLDLICNLIMNGKNSVEISKATGVSRRVVRAIKNDMCI